MRVVQTMAESSEGMQELLYGLYLSGGYIFKCSACRAAGKEDIFAKLMSIWVKPTRGHKLVAPS